MRATTRSLRLLAASFRAQNAALRFGFVAWLGHACQKHPSTKMAILSFGKTKSGLPKTGRCRRQPEMAWHRKNLIIATSVARFPLPRMRDMTVERFALVNTSVMSRHRWCAAQTSPMVTVHVDTRRHRGLAREREMMPTMADAILWAKSGGTAFPTCRYCSVRGPSKK